MEVEVAECISLGDLNPNRKRNRRGKAKYVTKVVAARDERKPFRKGDEVVIDGGSKEVRESGVRCDGKRLCAPSLHDLSNFGVYDFGAPVVDIYCVKITVNKPGLLSGKPSRVHGAIRLYTWYNSCYPYEYDELLYDVKKDDPQYIHLDSERSATLWLSGPKTALPTADTALALTFALKLDDRDVFPLPDDADADEEDSYYGRLLIYADGDKRFGAATAFFDPVRTSGIRYNKLRSRTVWGSYSELTNPDEVEDLSGIPVHVVVDYAILPSAVMAKVHVTILGEHVDRVWGCIKARPCVLPKAIVLFDKSETESVAVDARSRSIQLTRSLLGVPGRAFLMIGARLHNANGDLIVDEISFFRACTGGTFYTTFGTVKFEVEWSRVPDY